MNFEQFKILVKALKSVYTKDNFLPDAESIKIWYSLLRDIPYEVLHTAIQKYMMSAVFPPTIADLRELSAEITQGKPKDWGDGWEQVQMAIRRYGYMRETEALQSMDSLTQKCVRQLGWQNLCASTNSMTDRANFRGIYQSLQDSRKEDMKLSLSVKEKMAQLLTDCNEVKRLEG